MSNPKDDIFSRSLDDPEIIEFNTKILKHEESLALQKGEKCRWYERVTQSHRLADYLSEQASESRSLFTAEQREWFDGDYGVVAARIHNAPHVC